MRGLMMDRPLSIISMIQYAAEIHGDAEIVSRTAEGSIHRYGYADSYRRAGRLAHALGALGVGQGDRVATLAWNGHRHFELYFAVAGMGAVCHTVNPRLFADQIVYIVNHAEDRVVFLDAIFVELAESLATKLPGIKAYVIMCGPEDMPETSLPGALCYETLLDGQPDTYAWPALDENTASSLCYTSGTTGDPKGALFSHRSTVLHTFATCLPNVFGLSSFDTVLPVVPMFHVNAWGIPYGCPMTGAKLVFPGARLDAESLFELLDTEKVTFTAGVPTIWMALLEYLRDNDKGLEHLQRITIGGAASPRSMIEAFENDYDVEVIHGWGMTEMSPVGTTGNTKGTLADRPRDERISYKEKQGLPVYGMEIKITDDQGQRLPHDGEAFGNLFVRSTWVIDSYFKDDAASKAAFDAEGWFRTGDVSTIDADGYMQIVDRDKDVIKSGGEWISSIDIENAAVAHADVAEAGVIGIADEKWGERPLLIVVAREDATPDKGEILELIAGKVAEWAVPDDMVVIDGLPHTATGKIRKTELREMFKDYKAGGD